MPSNNNNKNIIVKSDVKNIYSSSEIKADKMNQRHAIVHSRGVGVQTFKRVLTLSSLNVH